MGNPTHFSFFNLVTKLLLAGIFLILLIPSPAQADVGVHPVLPGGSNIQPEGDTPIQMAAEVVTMNVRSATQADNTIIQLNPEAYGLQFQPVWYPVVAEVTAVFTMTNPTSTAVSLPAWFPLASSLDRVSWELNPDEIVPRIARFQVAVDGIPLEYTIIELPNPKGTDKPALPWASFPVTFSAGKDTHILISYLLPLTQAVKGRELALYYIFQTGAGWAGPIGHAELILNLPYPASQETLARIPSNSLGLPYSMSDPRVVIPFDGVTVGNQARWMWTNFEPTSQEDFSIWLMDPVVWQDLSVARSAVQAAPQDGQAWLSLANIYRLLSVRSYNFPSIFSASHLTLGLEAYQKAIELLPDHPAPHTGLAMLTLAPYMSLTNAPLEVIQSIQTELQIARDLETAHPELAEEAGISSWLLEDSLSIYFDNVTATAASPAKSTASTKQTDAATLRLTPSPTSTPQPSLTPTTIPSPTLKPLSPTSTVALEPVGVPAAGLSLVIPVAAGVVILILVGFLVLGRRRG
jgi:hypothetical protein